jgi:hypothetical protein
MQGKMWSEEDQTFVKQQNLLLFYLYFFFFFFKYFANFAKKF